MRNVNYVDQGAGRYVVGDAAPYDQKNEMFKYYHYKIIAV
jgi:hypothetical protein